jgi:potassium channel subfamily K, other eukaryote
VINAVQLVIAVVSNLFLLMNMTRRVRFAIAQPITIVGWYISAFALIALTATAGGPLVPGDQPFVWSQAFWYGIYSAILYMLCATLMLSTFVGAIGGWYDKDFYLTASQRTLMLQTIMFLGYLLLGALVFSKIEGWAYLDAVYWSDVTLFTVGFGDFSAVTNLGRALLFPYALVGVISLGLVIGSIRSLVLERGKLKLDARMVEKGRRNFVRKLIRKGKDDLLQPIAQSGSLSRTLTNEHGMTELERRNEEFHMMRKIQAKAARRRRWMALFISSSTTVALWLVGAKIFFEAEKNFQAFGYFDGVYFCFVSLTTIGYGDVTPITNAGKSFFVFWSLLALPTMTVLISNAGDTIVKEIRDVTDKIGTVTILPGEGGIRKEIKTLLRQFPGGALFDDQEKPDEHPPGFLGNAQPDHDGDGSSDDSGDEGTEGEDAAIEGHGKEDEKHGPLHDRDHPGGEKTSSYNSHQAPRDKAKGDQPDRTKSTSHASHENGSSRPRQDLTPSVSRSDEGADGSQVNLRRRREDVDKGNKDSGRNDEYASQSTGNARRVRIQTSSLKSRKSTSPDSQKSQESPKSDKKQHKSRSPKKSETAGSISRTQSMPREDIPPDVPTDKADYHIMLIEEIERVSQHLKSHPPRKYTFKEWAWYLKLLGEDEGSSETHRKPVPHKHRLQHERSGILSRTKKSKIIAGMKDSGATEGSSPLRHSTTTESAPAEIERPATQDSEGKRSASNESGENESKMDELQKKDSQEDSSPKDGTESPDDTKEQQGHTHTSGNAHADDIPQKSTDDDIAVSEDAKRLQWSWVGAKSPLMGEQEEAEWILQKLMKKLELELKQVKSGGLEETRSPLVSELAVKKEAIA